MATNTEKNYKKTNLKYWNSEYLDLLEETIYKSKFWARAQNKPMTTPKADKETHLTTRATHMSIAAEIIERIANKLGLNGDFAHAAMLMHDAGHPFSAHQGEEIFDLIGRWFNTGYFHHNAKGVEVILSEDICGKTIAKIPKYKNDPEKRAEFEKNLREEFYYLLDVVISHDGEASSADLRKKQISYNSVHEAVDSKLKESNSNNNYKFIAQTDEGKLAKIADVLAYVPTDIQDAFRLGILHDFNDEYLILFGEMFAELDFESNDENKPSSDEERIAYAKSVIEKIKKEKIAKLASDMQLQSNQETLKLAEEVLAEAKSKGINTYFPSDEDLKNINKVLEDKKNALKKGKNFADMTEKRMFNAQMSELTNFVNRLVLENSSVVEAVTGKVEEYFEMDFVTNSENTGNLELSDDAERLFNQIRLCNGKQFVTKTRWDYQLKAQPLAATKLVSECARSLIRTGAIRDKFYNPDIIKMVADKDSEAVKYMVTKDTKPEKESEEQSEESLKLLESEYDSEDLSCRAYEQAKERYGIIGPGTLKGTFKEKDKETLHKHQLYKGLYRYLAGEYSNFVTKYINVFYAIEKTVTENVEFALGLAVDKKGNKKEIPYKEFLAAPQKKYNQYLRNRLIKKYNTLEEAIKHKDDIIRELVEEERNNMEEKLALQVAIDYISGMTDRSFDATAIDLGYMKPEEKSKSQRGSTLNDSVQRTMENFQRGLNDRVGEGRG